jgi:hypothetical protein
MKMDIMYRLSDLKEIYNHIVNGDKARFNQHEHNDINLKERDSAQDTQMRKDQPANNPRETLKQLLGNFLSEMNQSKGDLPNSNGKTYLPLERDKSSFKKINEKKESQERLFLN